MKGSRAAGWAEKAVDALILLAELSFLLLALFGLLMLLRMLWPRLRPRLAPRLFLWRWRWRTSAPFQAWRKLRLQYAFRRFAEVADALLDAGSVNRLAEICLGAHAYYAETTRALYVELAVFAYKTRHQQHSAAELLQLYERCIHAIQLRAHDQASLELTQTLRALHPLALYLLRCSPASRSRDLPLLERDLSDFAGLHEQHLRAPPPESP